MLNFYIITITIIQVIHEVHDRQTN